MAARLSRKRLPRDSLDFKLMAARLTGAMTVAACLLTAEAAFANSEAPTGTVMAGVGNAMGWYGVQGEAYFAKGRVSVFFGVGYAWDEVAAAGGVRVFTRGFRHRGFLEFSVSQLAAGKLGNCCAVYSYQAYGPGVQAGYQRVFGRGLTLLASAGVGVAGSGSPLSGQTQFLSGLGVGYTWR